MNGGELGGPMCRLPGKVQTRGLDGGADFSFGEDSGERSAGTLSVRENCLLEADLLGVGDAELLDGVAGAGWDIGHTDHEGGGSAADRDAPLLEHGHDIVDVVRPFDADLDQAPGSVEPQLIEIDDRRGSEFLGELAGGECVGVLMALGVGQLGGFEPLERSLMIPADVLGTGAPDFAFGYQPEFPEALGHLRALHDGALRLER